VLFVLGGHHPLGDVPAAARLAAGVPTGPPLNAEVGHEGQDGHLEQAAGRWSDRLGPVNLGRELKDPFRQFRLETGDPADFRTAQGQYGQDNAAAHRQDELEGVGD